MYRVNKEKCIGCGLCVSECDGATEIKEDGKAEVVDQKKAEECKAENVCPYGAIEKTEE